MLGSRATKLLFFIYVSCAARSSLVLRTRLPALALRIVEVWAAAQLLKSTLRAFYFIHS